MKALLLLMVLGLAQTVAAQTHTEKISKELTFEKQGSQNTLLIANINGSVKVESYEGNKILVEVKKTIHAKTDARLEKGKQAIQMGVIDRADTLILFVEGTCNNFSRATKKNKGDGRWFHQWNYNWSNGYKDCREEFDYKMDFTVKVPVGIHVMISTINDGDIVVENVKGSVAASNINGSIRLVNLVREARASTINGNVDVEYAKNPEQECRFYSLNGDINAWFQKGLAATMSFESFNGSFFTNISQLEPLPVNLEKKTAGEGIRYKVSGNRYKLGKGGPHLDFETFNGNVYLKER